MTANGVRVDRRRSGTEDAFFSMPTQAELVARLNRNVRRKTARISAVKEYPFGPSLAIRQYRLGNGLDIYLLADRSAPVISYHTWFRVGSRHENPGKTGLAHLFEHLMFNETTSMSAGEFDRRFEAAGGETNAATWTDWTYYYANIPKAELGLAATMEADRMANLVLKDRQVSSEKEVVANERRYRVDDDVEGAANELLYAKAFQKHPYHWPTIGWMEDIEGFTTEDCRKFYRTFYAPNNAIVVIAGDFEEAGALALLQEKYGSLKSSRIPKTPSRPEPVQRRERRLTIKRPTSADKIQIGYRSIAFADPDYGPLTVANQVLFGGRSSRLYRRLVTEGEIASDVSGSISPFCDPGLYEVWAGARSGHTAKEMLDIIDEELERIVREPVTDEELERVKNRLELSFFSGMETASGKAEQIGFYAAVVDNPGLIFERAEAYRAVTAEDIQAVAKSCFNSRQRTIVTVRPGST